MSTTQPADAVTLVADISLPPLSSDSCARVFVSHSDVDVMEVAAILGSNHQPRDNEVNVGMPGIVPQQSPHSSDPALIESIREQMGYQPPSPADNTE